MDILEQVALGVTEAHANGILHRDLKPQNIWLQPDGRGGYIVKVLDFGIAKLADPSSLTVDLPELEAAPNVEVVPEDENATQMIAPTSMGFSSAFADSSGFTTTVGATLGTPAFMSPEQCSGMPVSEKSDQYSLAMLAYLMLAGELPFKGNARELIEQQISITPDPPHTRNPKLSELISRVILESLTKDPEYRAPSVLSFVSRLRAAVEGEVNLLKESRSRSGALTGTWFSVIAMAVLPATLALAICRALIRNLMEQGQIEEWLAFALVIPVHVFIGYFTLIWTDMAMTIWLEHAQDGALTPREWFRLMWKSWKAYPRGLYAVVFTFSPLKHGIAHITGLLENLGVQAARQRSATLLSGNEHLVLALAARRIAVAWLIALYLPIVLILAQAPLRVVYRETVGDGIGSFLSIASFSFMPIYGSFLMAWHLLYDRCKRGLGEQDAKVARRYRPETGKIGRRVRLGTALWLAIPFILVFAVVIAPYTGWNERQGDSLSFAAREGRYQDVVAMLERGDDPNRGRGPGGEPVLIAVQNGDERLLRLLLNKGGRLNPAPRNAGPLHYAVLRQRPEMVRLLVELGANLDAADERDNTPLILAAKNGHLEIARYLLGKGAKRGNAALIARAQGHEELAQVLESK